jgi:hypothetical protein
MNKDYLQIPLPAMEAYPQDLKDYLEFADNEFLEWSPEELDMRSVRKHLRQAIVIYNERNKTNYTPYKVVNSFLKDKGYYRK